MIQMTLWRPGLAMLLLLAAAPAQARTSLDPRALAPLTEDELPLPPPPPPGPPDAAAPALPTAPAAPPAAPAIAPLAPPVLVPPAKPALPAIGAVPPVPMLPPPIVVPTRAKPPAAPLQVRDDAPGEAMPLPDGLRLTFGADTADLNPASAASLTAFVRSAPAGARFEINAYAAGAAADPSTPRRLSLSRALAVRGVLMAEGVASARIVVRALGAEAPKDAAAPADRADVIQTAPPPR